MSQRKPFLSSVERWLQWNIVTAISLSLALALLPGIIHLGLLVLPLKITLLASAAACGVFIGLAQAILLRLEIPSLARWATASGIGCATGVLLMGLLFQFALPDGIIEVTLAGAVLGSFQASVLSLPSQRAAWIVSTSLGWIAAACIALVFFASRGITLANTSFYVLRSFAAGWVLFALVLLFAVLILFPRQEERNIDERIRWLP